MAKVQLFYLLKDVWALVSRSEILMLADSDYPEFDVLKCLVKVPIGSVNNKSVVLGVTGNLGTRLAADMFEKEEHLVGDSDVLDVIGEVADMIAEGVKVQMGDVDSVGLPQTVSKNCFLEQLRHCKVSTWVCALSERDYLYVAVLDCSLK